MGVEDLFTAHKRKGRDIMAAKAKKIRKVVDARESAAKKTAPPCATSSASSASPSRAARRRDSRAEAVTFARAPTPRPVALSPRERDRSSAPGDERSHTVVDRRAVRIAVASASKKERGTMGRYAHRSSPVQSDPRQRLLPQRQRSVPSCWL